MKSVVILCGLVIISSLGFITTQELSKRKCDEYSRQNEAEPEPNEYRKYMDKFVIAKTTFKEYDAVLISEEYAMTSVSASRALQFTEIVVLNKSIAVSRQEQRDDIYLIKLKFSVELFNKIVCLWDREELPMGFDVFTVVHEAALSRVPFLRTYFPYTNNCSFVQPDSQRYRDNFCLTYENGRQSETVFENPTASSLVYLKSFKNAAGLNKNHYVMGVIKKEEENIYARKLWPHLRWIESVVWEGIYGLDGETPLEPECGRVAVANENFDEITSNKATYKGEFPWQAALFKYVDANAIKEEFQCGGTLLNRDTVLTAAHCITNAAGEVNQPARYRVKLGLYNLDGTESELQIKSVYKLIKHKLYNVSAIDTDIGLIKLDSLATYNDYVRPICLISHTRDFQKEEGVVPGWGVGQELGQGTLTIPMRNDCRHRGDYIKELLTEANFCAENKGERNVCHGDSGGGMVAEIDRRWFLRGIVSFGGITDGVCDPQAFSLFTNATYFYGWIQQAIKPKGN